MPPIATTNDLRDIKPPVDIPSGWEWLWWLLGALALALIAWLAWRHWRKKRAAPAQAEPIIPPDQRARQRLTEALKLIDQPRLFCIAVSDTVRVYLEERFALHAPERTTEEFLAELQHSPVLTPQQKDTLADFLARCDLVKFARYEPEHYELQGLHDIALRLVNETEPPPLPVERPPLATAASA